MPLTLVPSSESASLTQRLTRLRARLRAIVVLRQGSAAAIAFTLVVAALCILDWRFHLPALIRGAALAGILAGFTIVLVRNILNPWRGNASLLALAHRVERRFPDLNDSLVSTVQFLELPEEQLTGSPSLRAETIQIATSDSEHLDFNEAVSSRWTKRSLFGLLLVIAGAVWIAERAPVPTATALERLFVPFGTNAWPAKTRIELVYPQSVPHLMARGDAIDLVFRLSGVIPDRARLSIWLDDASPVEQVCAVERNEESPTESLLTVHLESGRVHRNFKFRLRANDADTGWQDVEVVPPLKLAPRDGRPSPQIHLTFPKYSEFPPRDLPDGNDTVEAVTGTRVQIRAAADRPIARVSLQMKPEQRRLADVAMLAPFSANSGIGAGAATLLSGEIWREIPVFLSADRVNFDVDFVPKLSGIYVLRLEDGSGLVTVRTFDIRIQADPSPVVLLTQPSAASEALAVLPEASFTTVAIINDVLRDKPMVPAGTRRVHVEYRTRAKEPFRRVPVYDGDAVAPIVRHLPSLMRMPLTIPPNPLPRLKGYALVRRLAVPEFAHANGEPLREGDVLTLRVSAEDYDNVTVNKPAGVSAEIDLQIVSPSQLDAALQQQMALIRNELIGLHALQRDARTWVREALQKLQQSDSLTPEDLERLKTIEQLQQQLRARIEAADEGLLARARRIKQTMIDNQLPRSPTTQRVDMLLAEVGRLAAEEIRPIEPLVAAARADLDKAPTRTGKDALKRAEQHQREVEETLRSLLERLEPWAGAGEMRGETRSILSELRRQIELLKQFQQGQKPGVIGAKRNDLPAENRNELDRAAVRPERLAERLRQLIEKLNRIIDEKEKAIEEKRAQLQMRLDAAKVKEQEARRQPPGSPAARDLNRQAEGSRSAADETRREIEAVEAEIQALRAAQKTIDAQSSRRQAQMIPQQIRDNNLGDAMTAQEQIAARLEKAVRALEERPRAEDENDLLQKKRPQLDAKLEELLGEQELLQKKIDRASQLTDPEQRAEALRQLAAEQERLEQKAQELARQMSRAGADETAHQLRQAARQMDRARQLLEQGMPPELNQEEALNHLDAAQAHLENQNEPEDELIREQLAKAADQIRALRERQFAAMEEEKRLSEKAVAKPGWDLAAAKQSLPGLINQQKALADEVRLLVDKRFGAAPVFSRMLRQSAEAMDQAVGQMKDKENIVLDQLEGIGDFSVEIEKETHQRIRARQQLALARLDQLLEALKPDQEMFAKQPEKKDGVPRTPTPKARPNDSLPPLAQLKALRALQADVRERTAAFDAAHPDRTKLTRDDLEELESLKRAQIDVAELVQSLTAGAMMEKQP